MVKEGTVNKLQTVYHKNENEVFIMIVIIVPNGCAYNFQDVSWINFYDTDQVHL